MKLLIVADDLSGAADCAAGCVAAGLDTAVVLDAPSAGLVCDVLAVDTDSRRLSAIEAAQLNAALWRTTAAQAAFYKKIDSTLRGNVAAEIAALCPLAGMAIVAPAFPAAGRTVRDGAVRVHGVPLEDTEIWRVEGLRGRADIRAMLTAAGLRTALIDAASVRLGAAAVRELLMEHAAAGVQAVVCDGITDDDLRILAVASADLPVPRFWVGSAGLAAYLPDALGLAPAAPSVSGGTDGTDGTDGTGGTGGTGEQATGWAGTGKMPAAERPGHRAAPADHAGDGGDGGHAGDGGPGGAIVTLVGSMSGVARGQAECLRSAIDGLATFEIPSACLRATHDSAARTAWQERVVSALRAGQDVLIGIVPDARIELADGPRLAAALASLVEPAAAHVGGVLATGGETARAMLNALGIPGLRLSGEVQRGLPASRTLGAQHWAMVTKAGAFGERDALLQGWRHLAALRTQARASAAQQVVS